MLSPITGKEMKVQSEARTFIYRKESFTTRFHYYLCEDSGQRFEDERFARINHVQVLNKYRAKHNLPFQQEIAELRERYKLSASKISEILGFGVNTYRNYENGEVPSTSNARLLQLAFNSQEFLKLVRISNALNEKKISALQKRITKWDEMTDEIGHCIYHLETGLPDEFNGYRSFNFLKTASLANMLCNLTDAFKTKLNKLLFYIDFDHFRNHGQSITGLQYCAISWGPVPNNFNLLFDHLVQLKYLNHEYHVFPYGYEGEKFLPRDLTGEQLCKLTESESKSVDYVVRKIGSLNSAQISELSHKEKGWIDNKDINARISYEYSFDLEAI